MNKTIEQKALDYARNSFGMFKLELHRAQKKKIPIEPHLPLLWDLKDVTARIHNRAHALVKIEQIFSAGVVHDYDQFTMWITVHLPKKLSFERMFLKSTRPLWEPILKDVYGPQAHLHYLFYL